MTDVTEAQIVLSRNQLAGNKCPVCEASKRLGSSLCKPCYFALPPVLRAGLWVERADTAGVLEWMERYTEAKDWLRQHGLGGLRKQQQLAECARSASKRESPDSGARAPRILEGNSESMNQKARPQPSMVEQYRAEVTLGNTKVSLTGPSPTEIQASIRALFGQPNVTFEKTGDNSQTIYQNSNLVGWIQMCMVPAPLSYEHQKKAAERAAA